MGHAPASSWQDSVVVAATEVADRIRRITLRPVRPQAVRPGEHVDVRVRIDGTEHQRSYSVVDATQDGSELSLSVFHTPTSRGGSTFMHTLTAGDRLRITTPQQDFPLRIGAQRYVLLAGGIGITALVDMARVLKRVKADYRVVYVGRTHEAMAYAEDLVAEHGDRITLHTDDTDGRFDVQALVQGIGHGTELYMCGPIRLMDAVRRAWAATDLDQTNLRYETFGNSGWFDPEPFRVRIPRLDVETVVGPGESLLEALERDGVEMMSDCRKGECGICQVKVLDVQGQADHRDVFHSDRQKDATKTLCPCVSRVACGGTARAAGPAVLTIDVT
ncbi:PDR/VanB family oxidoreductase [Citricoccus sp.]|uniref:PDR/VanB family oxidoreductase n=1 Tax=Citricoccus sp. TaxID=1978372 RepID=UPI0026050702|nr:PDR/VanB family oxidoreductase [Citricoccus sp.]HRO29011.1 PDR/VanB family oxidoreductase [Citricoccus sp.]